VLKIIIRHKEDGPDFVMRSFIICSPHQILVVLHNQEDEKKVIS
jgi:hypothetical protein